MSDTIDLFLQNWGFMNSQLASLREDQLKEMINAELAGKKRKDWLIRMHQRYSKLVTARERIELLGGKLL